MNQSADSPSDDRRYWAFISYSHRDQRWVTRFHRRLERLPVPRKVRRAVDTGSIPRRLKPIYLDRFENAASHDLGATTNAALDDSRFLIVVCSPHAARSRWVNEEVRRFKASGRGDRILPVIVDGEPNADAHPEATAPECFPDALRFDVDPSGAIGSLPEPMAAEARPGLAKERDAVLRVAAGMLGVSFDEFQRRDRQRRIRLTAGVTCVALCVVAALVLWRQTVEQRRVASALAAEGRQLLLAGDVRRAAPHLAQAFIQGETSPEMLYLLAEVSERLELPLLEGHSQKLTGIRFSRDATRILTTADDGTAAIWDTSSGQRLHVLTHPTRAVSFGDFSPDGRYVVTTTRNGTVRLWDASTGMQLHELRGSDGAVAAAFDAASTRVATADLDGTTRVWDVTSGTKLFDLRSPDALAFFVPVVAFTPTGDRIMTLGVDGVVRMWDAQTHAMLRILGDGRGTQRGAELDPSGKVIVTLDDRGVTRLWSAEAGRLRATLEDPSGGADKASFSPDGQLLITVGPAGVAVVWDVASGREIGEIGGRFHDEKEARIVVRAHSDAIKSVVSSANGALVATMTDGPVARLWAVDRGRRPMVLDGHDGGVAVAFSPAGDRALTWSDDGLAKVWDATTGKPIVAFRGHDDWVLAATFDDQGERVATTSRDGTARVWDVRDGRQTFTADVAGEAKKSIDALLVNVVDLSPDGKRLLTGGQDGIIRIWDVERRRVALRMEAHRDGVWSAAFSRDGATLLTAGEDARVRLWDAGDGKQVAELTANPSAKSWARFSNDGTRIIAADSQGSGAVWDRTSGRLLAQFSPSLETQGELYAVPEVKVSRDDRLAVSLVPDGSAAVWSTTDGRLLTRVGLPNVPVHCATFSPDGLRVVTGDEEGMIRVWDVSSGHLLAELRHSRDAHVVSVDVAPQGDAMLSGAADGTALAWHEHGLETDPERLVRRWKTVVPWQVADGHIVDAAPGAANLP
ncbi:TIR domain-containing protein [Candidatus Binatia bacterium]|nr:TIR domain-containing protein [Candidatus Binatia bacterium]